MLKKSLNLLLVLIVALFISCSSENESPLKANLSKSVTATDEWDAAYFRGTPNSWGTTPMTKVAPNTWEITVKFDNGDANGGPRFKIDKGEWSETYPEQDYGVSASTNYKITFYDNTHNISIENLDGTAANTNGTMMQYFHWYYPSDGSLWNKVNTEAENLSEIGINALWLPPAYKGGSQYDVGYGVYDMYDLGEFDQKGTVRTKYGTKDEYLAAIESAHSKGISIYGDVVFNHRGGADYTEAVNVIKVDSDNRNVELHSNAYEIDAWTGFNFEARNNKYSDFKYHWYHFDGVDWDARYNESAIYKFASEGKGWDWTVTDEKGNYDYLMYADLDFDHSEVVQETKDWADWYINFTGVDGFRLDAIKHIKYEFISEWISHLRNTTGKELFTVGEFWDYDLGKLTHYIDTTNGDISLFDAPLHMNFYTASKSSGSYDMRNLMNGTLMQSNPLKAVTLVENHDTQPLQALESPVDWWFKPLAYAFILLREEGYPSVFYADLYGAQYTDNGYDINMVPVANLEKLVQARKLFAYGDQISYMDHWDVIGWTRLGDEDHNKAMAVIMSDGSGGTKWMNVGKANKTFYDYTGTITETITSNNDGWAEFKCNGGSVSVWVEQ